MAVPGKMKGGRHPVTGSWLGRPSPFLEAASERLASLSRATLDGAAPGALDELAVTDLAALADDGGPCSWID